MTCDTRHVTHDTWCGVNVLSKFKLSSSNGLGVMMFWRSGGKGWMSDSVNQLITILFVEQPRLHWVWQKLLKSKSKFLVLKYLLYSKDVFNNLHTKNYIIQKQLTNKLRSKLANKNLNYIFHCLNSLYFFGLYIHIHIFICLYSFPQTMFA